MQRSTPTGDANLDYPTEGADSFCLDNCEVCGRKIEELHFFCLLRGCVICAPCAKRRTLTHRFDCFCPGFPSDETASADGNQSTESGKVKREDAKPTVLISNTLQGALLVL